MHPGTTYLVVGLAALAGACASQSDTIPPTYVSPSTYENMTCRQLGEEVKRVTRAEAASTQTGKPADAADVGLFKGTMDALEQVSIEKGCNIQFQHESTTIEKTEENRSLLPNCYPPLCTTHN